MQALSFLFNPFVDLLIPFRCIKCGIILRDDAGLCSVCWSHVPFITKPYCNCCGFPFEFDIEEEALCALCIYIHPSFKTARSVFSYQSESKDLILKFKHTDSISSAPVFAKWMTRLCEEFKDPLCVPVPLHWTRLFMRTYNQAALLAREIAKQKGWTYAPTCLIRKHRTPIQGYLSKKERLKNVSRAFIVPQGKKDQIKNQTILLIDDVFTTGATLNECSKVLLKAGAKQVHALTLGRVSKGQQL
jgi:ComF family protein